MITVVSVAGVCMKFFVREKFAAFVRASGEWKRAKPDFVALSMEEM